jgi:hypothetical protein
VTSKPQDYGHMQATLVSIAMTQHPVNKGLKVFGEAGVSAVLSKLQQLHDSTHMFQVVNEDAEKLDEDAAHIFSIAMLQNCCSSANKHGLTYKQPSHSYVLV